MHICAGAHELTYKERKKQTNTQNKTNTTQHKTWSPQTTSAMQVTDSLIIHESTQSYIPEDL